MKFSMKYFNIFISIFVFFSFRILFAENKLFEEPTFTKGTNNIICRDGSDYVIWYISDDSGQAFDFTDGYLECELAKEFPPLESIPLKHGMKYTYFLKQDTAGVVISNTVFSIQDTAAPSLSNPYVDSLSLGNWINQRNIEIHYTLKDFAGIDKAFLYLINSRGDSLIDSYKWSPVIPIGIVDNDSVQDSVSGVFYRNDLVDGEYKFLLGARDAAHDPSSREGAWQLNGNETIFYDDTLKVNVDATPPISYITDPPDGFYSTLEPIRISYKAFDPLSAPINFNSGLDSVSLYYHLVTNGTIGPRNFYDSTKVHSDNDTTFGYFDFIPPEEGVYLLYTSARDVASNIQASSEHAILITADSTKPVIEKFELSDLDHRSLANATRAVAGWTNELKVGVNLVMTDNIAGLKTILLYGDIVPDSQFVAYENINDKFVNLAHPESKNIVNCVVSDNSNNWSEISTYTIQHDSTCPKLIKIQLADLDGDTSITNSDIIHVTPTLSNTNNQKDNLYRFALMEFDPDSLKKYSERDTNLIYEILEKIEYQFQNSEPGIKTVYCVVCDSAGNVSNVVKDKIELVDNAKINSFKLKDLDLPEDRNQKFTNEYTVRAEIYFSRMTEQNASLDFSLDSNFEDIFKNVPCPITNSYQTDDFEFPKDWLEGRKIIYTRLIEPNIGNISDVVSYSIILDTTPPVFTHTGLVLRDITPADQLTDNIEIKAASGWTNSTSIFATFDSLSDNLSGVDSLKFYGDCVSQDTVYGNEIDINLNIADSRTVKEGLKVVVQPMDSAGNWGDFSAPNFLDSAFINYKSNQPSFTFISPEEDKILSSNQDSIQITFLAGDDQDATKLWRALLWQFPKDSSQCLISNPKTNEKNITIPLQGNGRLSLYGIVADSAGNTNPRECLHITNPEKDLKNIFNVPNPFNPYSSELQQKETTIIINTESAAVKVDAEIFDVFGNKVADKRNLKYQQLDQCRKFIIWDGRNLYQEVVGDGVYIAVVKYGTETKPIKIAVSKRK